MPAALQETFRNIAPRRDRPVTAEDFVPFGNRLGLYYYGVNQPADPELLDFWNRNILVMPQTAYDILSRGLPPAVRLSITDIFKGRARLGIRREELRDGRKYYESRRYFDFDESEVQPGNVNVCEDLQGMGIGRTLIRNEIEFFHACGMKRMKIEAGSTNGGYTWAQFGFELDGAPKAENFSDRIERRLAMVKPVLSADAIKRVQRSLASRDMRVVWEIAAMKDDITPYAPDMIRTSSSNLEARTLRDAYYDAVNQKRPLSLGRFLLIGTFWEGVLRFDDAAQMKRAHAYCGFKYIQAG